MTTVLQPTLRMGGRAGSLLEEAAEFPCVRPAHGEGWRADCSLPALQLLPGGKEWGGPGLTVFPTVSQLTFCLDFLVSKPFPVP